MSDCGVCLDTGDYDPPEMYSERIVVSRCKHTCCECNREIPKRTQYQRASGRWDGGFEVFHTCMDCMHIRDAFRCGGGFMFEQLWETLADYRDEITSHCVTKINTVSAKLYFLERLRKFRGIEV